MIIVTGAAGFIGSNLVRGLNELGYRDILAVDDLSDGTKFVNLLGCDIADYLDKEDFLTKILRQEKFSAKVNAIFHQGACAVTTEWDGRFMMRNNYDYSKNIFHYCLQNHIPFIYASSAAVYGNGDNGFTENLQCEKPLNLYGYSKYQFDQYVRRFTNLSSQVAGLRYFNVYGPHEQHKGAMASVAFHLQQQLLTGDVVKLFVGTDGYADGEQRRDFIYVDDVVKINLWLLQNNQVSGIFNAGTGRSQTFNEVAKAVIAWHDRGKIQYIPFPENLQGYYQSFTQADITALRQAGYQEKFKTVAEGVKIYLDQLAIVNKQDNENICKMI